MRSIRRRFGVAAGAAILATGLTMTPAVAAQSASPPASSGQLAACDAPAWQDNTAYQGGDVVSHAGHEWKAKWWNWGQEPGTGGVWVDLGSCEGGGNDGNGGDGNGGDGNGGDGDSDTQAPSVPAGLHATATTSSSVSLGWNASSDNVGVTGYVVYEGGTQVTTASGTSVTVHGLAPSTSYSFSVAARDAAGNVSARSATVTVRTSGSGNDGGDNTGSSDYVRAGYYMQWSTYQRDYQVKNLITSGAASKLTHLNYAFIKIEPVGNGMYECVSGDPYADYVQSFGAAESVDGVADTWDQDLRGNFNQLVELQQRFPDLKVFASIGGWTWSQYFSEAASTEASREHLVDSCVDMLLRGNLPKRSNAGGKGVASEVFDGIDIDWEWPASAGHPHNDPKPADKHNYTLLLKEFGQQMNALEQDTGEDYGLTAFLPASEAKIEAGFEVNKIFEILSFANIQGYDLHGAWDSTTNHQSQIYSPPDDPAPADQQFSVRKAINAYLERGAPARKMTIGIPFYGRGWEGVPEGGTHGLYQPADGAAPGEFSAADGIGSYEWLMDTKNLQVYFDEQAMASWGYANGEMWTFDTPRVIKLKMQWVKEQGLLGAMIWPMSGDTPDGDLMTAIDKGLN